MRVHKNARGWKPQARKAEKSGLGSVFMGPIRLSLRNFRGRWRDSAIRSPHSTGW